MTALVPDSWPDCACRGGAPQMIEHSLSGCSVLPTVLADAVANDRPLTDAERDAIHEAEQRRRARGYTGPRMLRWADAVTPRPDKADRRTGGS